MKKSGFILVCFMGIILCQLFGRIRPEFQSIIDLYANGELKQCQELVTKVIAENDEERAILQYHKALLSKEIKTAKMLFREVADKYTKSKYSQLALLELGKSALLERQYQNALALLKRITSPELTEKNYWLATVYYQMNDFSAAISTGELYLRTEKSNPLSEEISFLLANAYFILNQYNNAVITLKKLLAKLDSVEDKQYLYYLLGCGYENLGNVKEALSYYKQGYEQNRYSQLAYMIEDNLFALRDKFGNAIDLNFLYPYSDIPLLDIALEANPPANGNYAQNGSQVLTETDRNPVSSDSLQAGIYLQAGRFSSKDNAQKLCEKINKSGIISIFHQSQQKKEISWVILCGPFPTMQEAKVAKEKLKQNNIDSFIIQR